MQQTSSAWQRGRQPLEEGVGYNGERADGRHLPDSLQCLTQRQREERWSRRLLWRMANCEDTAGVLTTTPMTGRAVAAPWAH
jgi:hypothetical protein